MAWLRLHDEVVDDPKVQMLPPILFRAWINCLCITKQFGGALPDVREVAYKLHVTEARADSIVKDLIDAGLLEKVDGRIIPHNWNGRQFLSDVSTERVRQFRQRSKKQDGNVPRNADETFHETYQRQSTDTDTDTDTEGERENASADASPSLSFGEFQSVQLTEDQAEKLKSRLNGSFEKLINELDRYSQTHPAQFKKYKSHYAVLINWHEREKQKTYDNRESRAEGKQRRTAEAARAVLDHVANKTGGRFPV